MPTVSVVIVNYNGLRFLEELFASLARQTRPADEVFMIDNASIDGSVEYTRRHFPWVRVIPQAVNVGFAEGNNVGVAHAQGEFIALLNSDTVVDERWLAELVQAIEADERVGIAVSKIYLASAHPVIDCVGAEFNNLGFCWGRGANQPDCGQFDIAGEVPAATACAMLLRREALAKEPLFDGEMFMYYEEFDLSLRVRGRGFRIVAVPTALVHHKRTQSVKGTTSRPLIFTQFYGNRNRVKILAKYYPLSLLFRSSPLILLSLIYWNWQFFVHGGPRLLFQAVVAQVRFAWQGLRERRRLNNVSAEAWLNRMTRQGLRDILTLRAELGEYTA